MMETVDRRDLNRGVVYVRPTEVPPGVLFVRAVVEQCVQTRSVSVREVQAEVFLLTRTPSFGACCSAHVPIVYMYLFTEDCSMTRQYFTISIE